MALYLKICTDDQNLDFGSLILVLTKLIPSLNTLTLKVKNMTSMLNLAMSAGSTHGVPLFCSTQDYPYVLCCYFYQFF